MRSIRGRLPAKIGWPSLGYLPGLDLIGYRFKARKETLVKDDATRTWVIGGDFNETRSPWIENSPLPFFRVIFRAQIKFIDNFLPPTVRRIAFSHKPGWTRRPVNARGPSLDIASPDGFY